jgi:hypothetical protein
VIVAGSTIGEAPGGGDIQNYDAYATYNPAGINILEVRDGDPPFTGANSTIDNVTGRTDFWWNGAGGAPGMIVSRLVPRLMGNAGVSYDMTVYFTDISGSGGWAPGDTEVITYRRGDTNNDGSVTIKDAMFGAQYVAGNRALTEIEGTNVASVNHDGAGDQALGSDNMFIAQYRVGLRDAGFNWL